MSRRQRSRWLCGIRRCFRPRWANGFGVRRRNRFFSPRSYTRRAKEKTAVKPVTGTVMLLMNDHGEEDPVRDGVMPVVSQELSRYGIEHRYVNLSRLLEEPERLSEFRAIVFCNDLQGVQLPEKFPGVQVFGWDPRGGGLAAEHGADSRSSANLSFSEPDESVWNSGMPSALNSAREKARGSTAAVNLQHSALGRFSVGRMTGASITTPGK